ncbi:MAG: 2-oxo acid dehydrogenase subunit E2 [bacterium]
MIDFQGKYRALSANRRVIIDLMHEARNVPSIPVVREMDLGDLVEIRRASSQKISWFVIFMKAFSVVAHENPILRSSLIRWPWMRLYEHPFSVCSIAIEREFEGESCLFFAHFRGPEYQSLQQMQTSLDHYKGDPVDSIAYFRRLLQIGRLPLVIRRMLWALSLNFSGMKRAKRMGTFGITSYGSLGAESLHPISPLAFTLNFGPISKENRVAVKVVYDHRIIDGSVVARRLLDIENTMRGPIRNELLGLETNQPVFEIPDNIGPIWLNVKAIRFHLKEKLFRLSGRRPANVTQPAKR